MQFIETQIGDQSISTDLDGIEQLHRLPLADSCNEEQVHTEDDGIKLSSNRNIREHAEDILEGGRSIEAKSKISSTGGQQINSKSDARQTKKYKGRNKQKGKKSKVTFTELLEKYKKESKAKSAYWPSIAKVSKSQIGRAHV